MCACFYKLPSQPVQTDSDYCFLCSAWLLCSVTIVAEHSWSFLIFLMCVGVLFKLHGCASPVGGGGGVVCIVKGHLMFV